MSKLFSINGGYPAPLPDRIRDSAGLTRTDIKNLSDEELSNLGYVEVNDIPSHNVGTQTIEWNSTESTWKITDIPTAVLDQRLEDRKVRAKKRILKRRDEFLSNRLVFNGIAIKANPENMMPVLTGLLSGLIALHDTPRRYIDIPVVDENNVIQIINSNNLSNVVTQINNVNMNLINGVQNVLSDLETANTNFQIDEALRNVALKVDENRQEKNDD